MVCMRLKYSYATGLFGACLLMSCASLPGHLTLYQVPAPVLSAFRKAYPQAVDVEFREQIKRSVKVYTVEFVEDGLPHEVDYTISGKPLPNAESKATEEKPQPEAAAEEKPD